MSLKNTWLTPRGIAIAVALLGGVALFFYLLID